MRRKVGLSKVAFARRIGVRQAMTLKDPVPFGRFAGTDSHGPMDPANMLLTHK